MAPIVNCYLWRIQHLVSTVTKRNYSKCVAELRQLLLDAGLKAQLKYLVALIRETKNNFVVLRDQDNQYNNQIVVSGKNSHAQFLPWLISAEISDLISQHPKRIHMLCHAIEVAFKSYPPSTSDGGSLIRAFCQFCKLSITHKLELSCSFIESVGDRSNFVDEYNFLNECIQEYFEVISISSSESPTEETDLCLSASSLHQLLRLIQKVPNLVSFDTKCKDKILYTILLKNTETLKCCTTFLGLFDPSAHDLFPNYFPLCDLNDGTRCYEIDKQKNANETCQTDAKARRSLAFTLCLNDYRATDPFDNLNEVVSTPCAKPHELIKDIGFSCVSTKDELLRFLSIFDFISAVDVVNILMTLVSLHNSSSLAIEDGDEIYYYSECCHNTSILDWWNSKVFVECLNEVHPELDWNEVFACLGSENVIHVRFQCVAAVEIFSSVYKQACHSDYMPLNVFISKKWKDTIGQLTAIGFVWTAADKSNIGLNSKVVEVEHFISQFPQFNQFYPNKSSSHAWAIMESIVEIVFPTSNYIRFLSYLPADLTTFDSRFCISLLIYWYCRSDLDFITLSVRHLISECIFFCLSNEDLKVFLAQLLFQDPSIFRELYILHVQSHPKNILHFSSVISLLRQKRSRCLYDFFSNNLDDVAMFELFLLCGALSFDCFNASTCFSQALQNDNRKVLRFVFHYFRVKLGSRKNILITRQIDEIIRFTSKSCVRLGTTSFSLLLSAVIEAKAHQVLWDDNAKLACEICAQYLIAMGNTSLAMQLNSLHDCGVTPKTSASLSQHEYPRSLVTGVGNSTNAMHKHMTTNNTSQNAYARGDYQVLENKDSTFDESVQPPSDNFGEMVAPMELEQAGNLASNHADRTDASHNLPESHQMKPDSSVLNSVIDIEREVNLFFTRFYAEEIDVKLLLHYLEEISKTPDHPQLPILAGIMKTLFNQVRHFSRYPPRQLDLTARLLGGFVCLKLTDVHRDSILMSLRCVVEALRTGDDAKIIQFGITAMEQFLDRFPVFPNFVVTICQIKTWQRSQHQIALYAHAVLECIPHDLRHCQYLDRHSLLQLKLPLPPVIRDVSESSQIHSLSGTNEDRLHFPSQSSNHSPNYTYTTESMSLPSFSANQSKNLMELGMDSHHGVQNFNYHTNPTSSRMQNFGIDQVEALLKNSEITSSIEDVHPNFSEYVRELLLNLTHSNLEQGVINLRSMLNQSHYNWLAFQIVKSRASNEHILHGLYLEYIERLQQPKLMESVVNMTYRCFNVLISYVAEGKDSSSYRTVLKNFGLWLGMITLGRNRPLKLKNLNLKNLLIEGYEKGLLVAVLPLTCKIIEGVKSSKNFMPPNPWTTAIFNLLAEIHNLSNIRSSLAFEIELLFKKLQMNVADHHGRTSLLSKRERPASSDDFSKVEETSHVLQSAITVNAAPFVPQTNLPLNGNYPHTLDPSRLSNSQISTSKMNATTDNNFDRMSNLPQLSSYMKSSEVSSFYDSNKNISQEVLSETENITDEQADSRTVFGSSHAIQLHNQPNESRSVVNQSDFSTPDMSTSLITATSHTLCRTPEMKQIVPIAVNRAVSEIVSAVIGRSVSISCVTTRELVLKDFAREADVHLIQCAARLMVCCMAGSLALVTCREPLRVALTNHLRQLLQQNSQYTDTSRLDSIVQVVSSENLDLGCHLIEHAVIEKAFMEIDQVMATELSSRLPSFDKIEEIDTFRMARQSLFSRNSLVEAISAMPSHFSKRLLVYKDFAAFGPLSKGSYVKLFLRDGLLQSENLNTRFSVNGDRVLPSHTEQSHKVQESVQTRVSTSSQPSSRPSPSVASSNSNQRVAINAFRPTGSNVSQTTTTATSLPPMLEPVEIPSVVSIPFEATIVKLDECLGRIKDVINNALLYPPIFPPNFVPYKRYTCSSPPSMVKVSNIPPAATYNLLFLSCLPSNHEIFTLYRSIDTILNSCTKVTEATMVIGENLFNSISETSVGSSARTRDAELAGTCMEVHLSILERLSQNCEPLRRSISDKLLVASRMNANRLICFIRYNLLELEQFDQFLARHISNGFNISVIEFCIHLLHKVMILQRTVSPHSLPKTLELLREVPASNLQSKSISISGLPPMLVSEGRQQLLETLASISSDSHQKTEQLGLTTFTQLLSEYSTARGLHVRSLPILTRLEPSMSQKYQDAYDEWLNCRNRSATWGRFFFEIHKQGFLKLDDSIDSFFSMCVHRGVQLATISTENEDTGKSTGKSVIGHVRNMSRPDFISSYMDNTPLDAFPKMIFAIMQMDRAQASPVMLQRALGVVLRFIHQQADELGPKFNQRPYFRILLSFLIEICGADQNMEKNQLQWFVSFSHALLLVSPLRIASFSFAWLELIGHRLFLPNVLKNVRGWPVFYALLLHLFEFLHPFLREGPTVGSIQMFYKGTLRVMLILLHDFPEFLCDYHFGLSDAIPYNCVQLRNLILSAFPRNIKLPDPFYPNLKVSELPDVKRKPRVLSNWYDILLQTSMKSIINTYFKTQNQQYLHQIRDALLLGKEEALKCGTKYNIPLMNSTVFYVSVGLPGAVPDANESGVFSENCPSLEIILYLTKQLDMDGRYILLSTIANHLRYPNAHSHYFYCLLLWIFAECKDEIIQEQITRVLLERLIVHRPHPWGLLITFFELMKNARFQFRECAFIYAAPEVGKLFESMAQTCLAHRSQSNPNEESLSTQTNS